MKKIFYIVNKTMTLADSISKNGEVKLYHLLSGK